MSRRHAAVFMAITALAGCAAARAQGNDEPRCVVDSREAALAVFVSPGQTGWFVPERVERIAVERVGDSGVTVTLRAGDASWPLQRTGGTASMSLAEPQRKAWRATGRLRVEVHSGAALIAQFALRAVPERLELPGEPADLTIVQRCSAQVPGSGGYLQVQLGDITAGQVLLELRTAGGEPVIAQRSVHAAENLPFSLGAEHYVLRVRKLVNYLIGDDYAVLAVERRARFEQNRIEALLVRLEHAAVTFEREGQPGSAAEAAAHLRRKLSAAGAETLTLPGFIDQIASRSSATGSPFQVRKADGSRVEAREWLTAEADAIEREEAAAATRPASRPTETRSADRR